MDEINDLFNGISSKQWKQKIQYELNGKNYNTLIWEDNEQVPVRPFYHFDDKTNLNPNKNQNTTPNIAKRIYVSDVSITIKRILLDIKNGITNFILYIPNQDIKCIELLNGLPLDKISIFLDCQFLSPAFKSKITSSITSKHLYWINDAVHKLTSSGNWYNNYEDDIQKTIELNDINNSSITIKLDNIQNSGGTITQQLGFGMAHLNEYINHTNDLPKIIIFEIAIGSNYFFEIAKIKALRLLFKSIFLDFKEQPTCHIIASPSKRNKTVLDYENNTVRTTTEYLSALLGGADTIALQPADFLFKKDNLFSTRLAKNQIIILTEEFLLNLENSPTEGVYYIDYLTQQLAQKSLDLFKEIERKGGYLSLLKKGEIQKRIDHSATKEQELFDTGEKNLIGINKYFNLSQNINIDNLELYPFSKIKSRKTIIKPFIEKRLAEKLELQIIK